MEPRKTSDAAPLPPHRNSLLSLVQGLGIKLPSECVPALPKTSHVPLDFRLGEPSPLSGYRGRVSGAHKSASPPGSPRATSPVKGVRPGPRQVTSPTRPASSPRSPQGDSTTFKKLSSKATAKKPISLTKGASTSKIPTKSSPLVKPTKKKDNPSAEAPAPVPLPLSQKEYEASQAMVSPRIDFETVKPPKPTSSELLMRRQSAFKAKQAQENRNLVLKSLVTKIDTSSDPTSEGSKSKAEAIYRKHLYQTFKGLKLARNLPPAEPIQLQAKRVVLMKPPGKYRPKTAVFDLDETLVHCLDRSETAVPDVVLPIRFPNGDIVHV